MYPGVRIDRGYFHGGFVPDYGCPHIAEGMAFDARRLAELVPIRGKRVGILGCAFGYSIYALRRLGAETYGLELSEYAVSRAEPAWADLLMVGDATDPVAMRRFVKFAGGRFDLLVSENLLPLLADEEVPGAVRLWRRHADQVIHRLSMTFESDVPREVFAAENEGAAHNWHAPSEWRRLIGDEDRMFAFEDWDHEYLAQGVLA